MLKKLSDFLSSKASLFIILGIIMLTMGLTLTPTPAATISSWLSPPAPSTA